MDSGTLLWSIYLFRNTVASQSLQRPSTPYLIARQNGTSGYLNTTNNFTVPDISNLCELGGSNDGIPVNVFATLGDLSCSDCITVSGVVVGTAVPTDLIPTNQTASYDVSGTSDTGINNRRAPLTHMPRATLMPRALKEIPLANPEHDDQIRFIRTLKEIISDEQALDITPSDNQLANWKIPLQRKGETIQTPGNTGFWYGHWWGSSGPTKVNGGSSFNYRYGSKDDDIEVRPLRDFKTIAIDPLFEPAPAIANSFVSLHDLSNIPAYGDPFGKGNGGGSLYIITKAAGTSTSGQKEWMYNDQITALKSALGRNLKPNTMIVRPYIGDKNVFDNPKNNNLSPAGVPKDLNGNSIIQFSPFAGTDKNGCPQAQARVWGELGKKPDVNRLWPASVQGTKIKRDGAAGALLISLSSPPTQSTTPCLPFADPHDLNNQGPVCQCSNGAKIPMVTTTNTQGTTVQVCPWTTIPPQALTTPAPISTNTLQYQYTYTDLSKKVIECQTFSTQHYAGIPVSFRVGSSAVLYEPPVASMEMGSSKVNVGTIMTGEVLFTSISNAVKSICPTPTSPGAWTSCATGLVKVGAATYLNSKQPEDGELTIHITDAQYNSTGYLNLFTQMLAGAANASATGSNCEVLDWAYTTYIGGGKRDIGERELPPPTEIVHKGNSTFCNINSFSDTQFYDGVQETAKQWFEAEFRFELGELGSFDCSGIVGMVSSTLEGIFAGVFPESAWLIGAGMELGELACQAAERFNKGNSRRTTEMKRRDAKLAKAWEKETKKTRMLPMPDHKKRELGLLD